MTFDSTSTVRIGGGGRSKKCSFAVFGSDLCLVGRNSGGNLHYRLHRRRANKGCFAGAQLSLWGRKDKFGGTTRNTCVRQFVSGAILWRTENVSRGWRKREAVEIDASMLLLLHEEWRPQISCNLNKQRAFQKDTAFLFIQRKRYTSTTNSVDPSLMSDNTLTSILSTFPTCLLLIPSHAATRSTVDTLVLMG